MSPADWWFIGGVYFLGYVVVMGWLFAKDPQAFEQYSADPPILFLTLGLFYPVWLLFYWSYAIFKRMNEG